MSGLDYMVVDLDRLRASGAIERAAKRGETFNIDGTTSFIAVSLGELIAARAVIDIDVTVPTRHPREGFRTPAWYERACEAQGRAVRRDQLTEHEATLLLNFWHEVCMRLPPPDGWTRRWRGSWWQR
jgi:hypothetical protein